MFWRTISIISVSAIMAALAMMAVSLRFVARHLKGVVFGVDDYLLVVGLILSIGLCICNIVGGAVGRWGDHEIDRNGYPIPRLLIVYGKDFYALKIIHTCAMPILKMSLLLTFRRIFGHNKRFRVCFWILTAYVGAWWFVMFWLTVFQCWPVSANWATSESAKNDCIPNYHALYSYMALTNVFSDVAVVLLPLPFIWTLNMSLRKRIATAFIFLTAAVVVVASVARTVSYFQVAHTYDYTYQDYYYLIWSSIEPCVGCIGCSLISLRPLFTEARDGTLLGYMRSLFATRTTIEHVGSEDEIRKTSSSRAVTPGADNIPMSTEDISFNDFLENPTHGNRTKYYNSDSAENARVPL